MKSELIRDKFKNSRAGASKLLLVSCISCGSQVAKYQKDATGSLIRMYLDRIVSPFDKEKDLACPQCHKVLGIKYIYEKENRPAYRLIQSNVVKKLIKS